MRRRPVGTTLAAGALAVLLAASCTGGGSDGAGDAGRTTTTAARPTPVEVVNTEAWPMHPIDGRFRGANGLGVADVNGDGRPDFLTNYEFDQRWILQLHPGDEPDALRRSWPTVEVWKPEPLVSGNGKNPESVTLGDFDGDGHVDAAGAHGFSDILAFEGSAPGIHLVWGPPADRVEDPAAWEDGGWVPVTVDLGHPHWVVAHDVNGDGLTDVVFGGRQHGGGGGYDSPDSPNGNGSFTGIAWLQAPAERSRRRDLSAWVLHRIDPEVPSGHGFVFADLDGDGDDDIVHATADFDTPQEDEAVVWYEHPGRGGLAPDRPWRRRVLYRSPDFWAKPSVAVGDLDGDGRPEVVTQTADDLVVFRNRGGRTPRFETVVLPKPEAARWLARPVRLADFDGDGDLDLFGMLIHDGGDLPAGKAAAFLLLNQGRPFEERGWRLVPVKWGSGRTMIIGGFGEKWDQVHVTDVDGDGDLDVVANCEEWWASPQGEVAPFFTPDLVVSSVAVVWFENTLGERPPVHRERRGRIEIEAERPSVVGDSTWVVRAPVRSDRSSAGRPVVAVQAHNGLRAGGTGGDGTWPVEATRGVTYRLAARGGDYTVWARVLVPSAFTAEVGGDTADSAWLAVDGGPPLLLGDEAGTATDTWTWVRVGEPQRLEAGRHRLDLRVREHGIAVDRIVLSADPGFRPD
jgi:hypothetical protein